MTLSEFLLARIAEDEDAARSASHPKIWRDGGDRMTAAEQFLRMAESEGGSEPVGQHFDQWLPNRVLAECAAKRQIVAEHGPANLGDDGNPDPWQEDEDAAYCRGCHAQFDTEWWGLIDECPTKRILASVYADHPDYQQEWAL